MLAGAQRGAAAGSAGCRGLARFLQAAAAHAPYGCVCGCWGSPLPAGTGGRQPAPSPSTAFGAHGPPMLPPHPLHPGGVLTSVFILGGAGGSPGGVRGSPGGWGLAPCMQKGLSGSTGE